jgi:PTH1 family peptidyl-tRNA hydrolase
VIIIGLGNPGLKYRHTRHNVGQIFVDRLAKKFGGRFKTKKGYRVAALGKLYPRVKLVKPVCYMNTSGPAVAGLIEREGPDEFMIVLDDINLPLGRIRLRGRGSDGGHLGLRSIVSALGTDDFARLRIGVGRPVTDAAEYVLASFDREEKKRLEAVLDAGMEGIKLLAARGLAAAQNHLNAVDLSERADHPGTGRSEDQ